jgi:alpha-glucoside transport system permease protein
MTSGTKPSTALSAVRRSSMTPGMVLVYGVLIFLTVAWFTPTLGLLVSSFRSDADVSATGWWTAVTKPGQADFTLDNYRTVLGVPAPGQMVERGRENIKLMTAVVNTIAVALPATVIPILIAAVAAYGFAWIRFPGRRWLFILTIGLMGVPLQVSLIPVLRDYIKIGLNGTYLGVWLAHTGFGLPLAVYLLYNYISSLPRDMFESAFIDGATHFTTFVRLILPLSAPALASFATFQFLWTWNDLLVPLVFLSSDAGSQVLTQRLLGLMGAFGQDWHLLTAGAFISMLLPLTVFFALQRYFVRGLMAGSVKQ